MSTTRRGFLESTAGLAAGLAGAGSVPEVLGQAAAPGGGPMPTIQFGKVRISRLVVGVNTFLGFGHYNNILNTVMKEWYTASKVVEVLQSCQKSGITAYNYVHMSRAQADWERFQSEGGRMHLVARACPGASWCSGTRTTAPTWGS